MPTPNLTLPFSHHVTPRSTAATPLSCAGSRARPNPRTAPWAGASSTRWIHCTSAMQASTNDAPTEVTASSAPLRGSRFPKKRTATNPSAGRSGMSQALRSICLSALQLVDAVEIRTAQVSVDEQHDRQAHAHLGGGDRDHEEGEHLAGDVAREGGERDQVDVDGVEHELDRQQHEDAVAPGEHAVDAAAEEECAQDEVLVERH